jgi:hypothetical protein
LRKRRQAEEGRKGARMKVEVSDGRDWKEGPGWRWVGWGQVREGSRRS